MPRRRRPIRKPPSKQTRREKLYNLALARLAKKQKRGKARPLPKAAITNLKKLSKILEASSKVIHKIIYK